MKKFACGVSSLSAGRLRRAATALPLIGLPLPPTAAISGVSLCSSYRHCGTSQASPHRGASHPSSSSASAGSATGYEQFQQQQQRFHRHSFYEKGSAPPRGDEEKAAEGQEGNKDEGSDGGASSSSSSSSFSSSSKRVKDERVYGQGSATAQQRRQLRQHWEKSFFGRMHFEDGMHSRFAQACASDEEEAFRQSIEGSTHAELFPQWPEDEVAPLPAFRRLRPSLQLRYIVNRLTAGERRVRYAADYGSLSMMYQLNLGEMMVNEAESLLLELGWMNDDVAAQIEEVKAHAAKVKYDFDLD